MSSVNTPTPDQLDRNAERTGDSTTMQSLMEVNNLIFKLPPSLSIVLARAHKQSHMAKDSYASGDGLPMSFTLATGGDYVYGPDSMITFTLEVTHTGSPLNGNLTFGKGGSILNIFKNIRIKHADGSELENIRDANVMYNNKLTWETSQAWRAGIGQTTGFREELPFSTNVLDNDNGFVKFDGTDTQRIQLEYAIPLGMLSDLFNLDVLLPSFLVAGLRFEADLEVADKVFTYLPTGSTDTRSGTFSTLSYVIKKPRVWLDQQTLSDGITKGLAVESSSRGLDVPWRSKWVDSKVTSQDDTFNITKALSRVESVTLVPRLQTVVNASGLDVATGAVAHSTFAPEQVYPYQRYQFSIGSQFIPSHPVENPAMALTLAYQGREKTPTVGFDRFMRRATGIARVNVERSQILRGSGLAINANRGASFETRFNDANARIHTIIVDFTALATVFLDNITVRK